MKNTGKFIRGLGMMGLVVLVGIGCSKENGVKERETKEVSIPKEYVRDEGNVKINANVILGEACDINELYAYTAKVQTIDISVVKDCLLREERVQEEHKNEIVDGYGKRWNEEYLRTDEDNWLSVSEKDIRYGTKKIDYITNFFIPSRDAEKYVSDEEFPFATKKDASEESDALLNKLGYKLDFEYDWETRSMPYEELKENEFIMDMDGNADYSKYKPEWTEEDDTYFMALQPYLDGAPVFNKNEYYKKPDIEALPVQVYYTRQGIEGIAVDKLCKFSREEKVYLTDFENVVNTVIKKYSNILGEEQYFVNQIELYQLMVPDTKGGYKVKPVWVFEMEALYEVDDEEQRSSFGVLVDACTGKEIL